MVPSVLLLAITMTPIQARTPIPPPMPRRPISQSTTPLPCRQIELEEGGQKFTLMIPNSWNPRGANRIIFHFHGALWHAVQEHLRWDCPYPMVAFYPGEGSSVYGREFADRQRLFRIMALVNPHLGRSPETKFDEIEFTSFSAGYGAVRELIQEPEIFARLKRVILCDSMYASLEESAANRTVFKPHTDVWLPLARAAMVATKEFVVTYSMVETPNYASSSECAHAIVAALGGKVSAVEKGTLAATLDSEFPLLERFDRGGLHIWGYGGKDAQAHITHVRHLADIYDSLLVLKRL